MIKEFVLKETRAYNIQETISFVEEMFNKYILNSISKDIIILLDGELGAGKTFIASNLIKVIAKDLDINVTSPTFNIISNYHSVFFNIDINHYDLYRINKPNELENISFYENLFNCFTIIEWYKNGFDYIKKFLEINSNALVFIVEINYNQNLQSRFLSIKQLIFQK